MTNHLLSKIRSIPDFPKPGIEYKDITTLLNDAEAFADLDQHLSSRYAARNIDYIAGIESRGFILGAMLAASLKIGFVPIRKAGKLPHAVYREEYTLEYGTDALEMHQDAFSKIDHANVLLIDDLLATGGTIEAALKLIAQANANCVEVACLIELVELGGRSKVSTPVYSVLQV